MYFIFQRVIQQQFTQQWEEQRREVQLLFCLNTHSWDWCQSSHFTLQKKESKHNSWNVELFLQSEKCVRNIRSEQTSSSLTSEILPVEISVIIQQTSSRGTWWCLSFSPSSCTLSLWGTSVIRVWFITAEVVGSDRNIIVTKLHFPQCKKMWHCGDIRVYGDRRCSLHPAD